MESDEILKKEAVRFVRRNKQKFIDTFAGSEFAPVENPVSVFMAGSPGAGKCIYKRCASGYVFSEAGCAECVDKHFKLKDDRNSLLQQL